MKKNRKFGFLTILVILFLSSCAELSKEAEKNLNELKNKTESLDSLINQEVDKVLTLDSLIDKTSSKIDSISTEKINLLEKIIK